MSIKSRILIDYIKDFENIKKVNCWDFKDIKDFMDIMNIKDINNVKDIEDLKISITLKISRE